ncbi:hypothetical protein F4811DRAFT_557890 [Daldinia bambusicola]|nr:hypothetical protein F4811DRAFT_557890 [Daldinia bambusicola]
MPKESPYAQEPMAIVGFGCRLPGGNTSPQNLWDFLERADIASRAVPRSRFNLEGHYDGSLKSKTLRQPGGMFLENNDLAGFDARFFEVGGNEAAAMDPNQRQLLEVVFESFENAGMTLHDVDNQPVGCFVASYACDYADMQSRDPEHRPANNAVGVARALLANRVSHFLNIKGPSVTLDTACSGSLQGLDIACHYLQSRNIDAAIVAASNLYMSPEHLIDTGGFGNAHSPTALCHVFDIAADGYVKAEAVSAIILKRLEDAIRDRDPIRAVVLGTASTSNGRTPGIASPSSASQALAIRTAYTNARIQDLNSTTYLECHGTATQAGDPTEIQAVGSVFAETRSTDKPLLIGSIKSNIGHSEPAAGNSGLIKAILALESGFIPGTPTFVNPSPKIDFVGNKVKAFRNGIPWPPDAPRRASINSFGVGGSNSHAIIEHPHVAIQRNHVSSYISADDGFSMTVAESPRPFVLVLSANDVGSLRNAIESLGRHLINPRVKIDLADLAYTLSERRTKFWHRACLTTRMTKIEDRQADWGQYKQSTQTPTLGFVFTGQGAQWPQMARDLLRFFPWTRTVLEELDVVLKNLRHRPSWSLIHELTEPRNPEHLRQPEFSQPLVTALQICIVAVLEKWGIRPKSVVGHSSGEIAAAYTAGLLDRASAITVAYYRGKAAILCQSEAETAVGMLAVGLGADAVTEFLQRYPGRIWIACFNSPSSVTVSGLLAALKVLHEELKSSGHFSRLLQVDMAYHTSLMEASSNEYENLLNSDMAFAPAGWDTPEKVTMFSSVTASRQTTATGVTYWKRNMVSPVQFDGALRAMLSESGTVPNYLIEIGPSGALAGPISQVLKSIATTSMEQVEYCSAWARGEGAGNALFDVAGRLWAAGHPVELALVNEYNATESCIVDLPNYSWDHTVKYWHENAASKDWRFKKFIVHDLLGSKILGTSWHAPTWRTHLNLTNLAFLKDHQIGGNIVMPGAGFVAMALEAMYQKYCVFLAAEGKSSYMAQNDFCYRFRNIRFSTALVLEEGKDAVVLFTLTAVPDSKYWHEFRISTSEGEFILDHCTGQVRIHDSIKSRETDVLPSLKFPQPAQLWYKWLRETGIDFGPDFQRLIQVGAITGDRTSDALISLAPTEGRNSPQSYYPIHPAALDGCLQTAFPAVACGDRTTKTNPLIPALIDDLIINAVPAGLQKGLSRATAMYSGRGRPDQPKNWFANASVYDAESGRLLVQLNGMHYVKVDMAPKPDLHTFHHVVWRPDVSFFAWNHGTCMAFDSVSDRLHYILDLVAHKRPTLRVLELNLDDADSSCLWFHVGNSNSSTRAAYSKYVFGSSNAKSLARVEEEYSEKGDTLFHQISDKNSTLGLPSSGHRYDLIIAKFPNTMTPEERSSFIDALGCLRTTGSYMLLVNVKGLSRLCATTNGFTTNHVDGDQMGSAKMKSPPVLGDSPANHIATLTPCGKDSRLAHAFKPDDASYVKATLPSMPNIKDEPRKQLVIASLSSPCANTALESLLVSLEASGWKVTHSTSPFSKFVEGAVVLVLDELWDNLLSQVNNEQWEAIKMLTTCNTPLLWVTESSQELATRPERAMVGGLFRVARQEDPSLKLITLDVQSSTGPATVWAIERVLDLLQRKDDTLENEYMERDGVLHVQRVVPDEAINDFRRGEDEGFEPVFLGLHSVPVQVQLRAERLGTFENLEWCATEAEELSDIGAGNVEVEVMAVGVNFKDVAIIMGIVPDDEYNIGVECAGFVRRVGPDVTRFKVGDRVCLLKFGSYANRIRVGEGRCHLIPDSMTFERAATIPSVYLCSLYALYHLGGLQEGQSVLIHSAAGGVGIACIELASHKKAEIFVTVGTEEKRLFLETKYDIPRSHMFSSRSTEFATCIMEATQGRGVDVIVNSLTGELLDASWRILADGGNMVEIGKRDIIDRNRLSMEPFDRNCSFRALDMSNSKHVNDKLIARLFNELFILISAGHIKLSHPITTFGFDKVVDALSCIRNGRHIGKIVISNGESLQDDVQIPIRRTPHSLGLKSNASYLVVGGLRGACGTLAIHMAQHGARNIIVMSRSGIGDEASARIVASCMVYNCKVTEAQGDVGERDFVRGVFESASPGIAGIVQGAMVLRDKPLEMMTMDDYSAAVHAKVQGTKTLHEISEELREQKSDHSLDFFTMLSSTSGIVGNKGQANYAAANTFLDAFASYRRLLGLPANTVDLGVIEDVGYIAGTTALQSRFDTRLWTPINERMLRKILTYSILQQNDKTTLNVNSRAGMITGIGYPLPIEKLDVASDWRFAYLFNSRATGDQVRGGEQRDVSRGDNRARGQVVRAVRRFQDLQKTRAADTAALSTACVEAVSLQIVKCLQLKEVPDLGRPLLAYGMDSLSAVELRNWIRGTFGVIITTLDIVSATSIIALCEKVIIKL